MNVRRSSPEQDDESGAVASSRRGGGLPCLTEDQALNFVGGTSLGPPDADVQRHLDECHSCRVLVGEAARAIEGVPSERDAFVGSTRELPLTLSVGEVIMERFRIVRFVARGGMGEVYEAHDAVLNETVALKTLACTALDDSQAMRRLMGEVRLARQVTHPNVCRILEFGFHRSERGAAAGEPIPFLTMEFLRGETLESRIARLGRISPDETAELLSQIVAGLGAIHAAGIVHRDIKPSNMVLLPGAPERLVLTDFGLAQTVDHRSGTAGLTGPVVLGTLDYMAPERLEGRKPSASVDIYALGVVLFEMLTGRKPFAAGTTLAAALARLRDPPPLPTTLVLGLDPIWNARVSGCLAREPSERFATVQDIVGRPSSAYPARRSRRRLLVLAGIVALAVTSVLVLTLTRTSRRASPSAGEGSALHHPRPVHRAFTARGCSEDMVRVRDRFCIDRFEAAAVDDVEERTLSPFYPPSASLAHRVVDEWSRRWAEGKAGSTQPLPSLPDWQLEDRWGARAVSRGGVLPQGYVSKFVAQSACASAGKRLCTAEEWTTACRGENDNPFPYGAAYRAGACNVVREEHPGRALHGDPSIDLLDPRMNQVTAAGGPLLRLTGTTPECKSIWGDDAVYDMVGNLDEWVETSGSAFYGGFYSRDTKVGCDAKIAYHPPSHFNYSTGFRCCDRVR